MCVCVREYVQMCVRVREYVQMYVRVREYVQMCVRVYIMCGACTTYVRLSVILSMGKMAKCGHHIYPVMKNDTCRFAVSAL